MFYISLSILTSSLEKNIKAIVWGIEYVEYVIAALKTGNPFLRNNK